MTNAPEFADNKQWAIMVPFEDEWLYVIDVENIDDPNNIDQYRPLLYNTREAAETMASTFQTYQVVEYESKNWQV